MRRSRLLMAMVTGLFLASICLAADAPPLATAQGTVDKVEKDSLTIKPRTADGKFAKTLVLRLTGTSKVVTLTPRIQAGKVVLTQRDTDAKELQPGQLIAVIYAAVKDEAVLLSAVVQPTMEK